MDLGSLEPRSEKRIIGGKEYVIREIDVPTAIEYKNTREKTLKFEWYGPNQDERRLIGWENEADLELFLVGRCVFQDGKAVGDVAKTWSYRVFRHLYDLLREMSPAVFGIKPKEGDDPKANASDTPRSFGSDASSDEPSTK